MPEETSYVGLRDLPWAEHDKALSDFVRATTNYYLRTSADTDELLPADKGILLWNNYATPGRMIPLLAYLDGMTSDLDARVKEWRTHCALAKTGQPGPIWGGASCLPGIESVESDLAKWKSRLINYKREHREAMKRDPNASGQKDMAYWKSVTLPLLTGVFPGETLQRVNDVSQPMRLAWQLDVLEESERERREKFWEDLRKQAADIVPDLPPSGAVYAVLGLAVIGAAFAYGYAKGK